MMIRRRRLKGVDVYGLKNMYSHTLLLLTWLFPLSTLRFLGDSKFGYHVCEWYGIDDIRSD